MPESQNIEYKSSWHDDYLKWVCGFANAQGGIIIVGKDDNGEVVGVGNHRKLVEEIPNKIRNLMGITAEVNLHEEDGKHFIEVVTHPYSVPISLRGRYYFRSGSTKQELSGASLNEFLLKRSGRTWDEEIEPDACFDDIDEKTVAQFVRSAQNSGRLPESAELTIPQLFEKLRLAKNGHLKRAAIVLFGKEPGKFYPNTFVKIGRFGTDDADLVFQETEEGNLNILLQVILQQLHHKFLIRKVSFEGMHRVETAEYPIPALREIILNALVHRNYMGAPTQIRVYDDKIVFWNEGKLPDGLTLESLKRTHSSRPRNPIIADVCFKGGLIDAWGRGTLKILDTCQQAALPEPELMERDGGFAVTLFKYVIEEQLSMLGLNERQLKAVAIVKEKGRITNKDYQMYFGVARRTATRDLIELTEKGVLRSAEIKGAGSYYEI
jgi:ATP-dependent DNA helicase RecG